MHAAKFIAFQFDLAAPIGTAPQQKRESHVAKPAARRRWSVACRAIGVGLAAGRKIVVPGCEIAGSTGQRVKRFDKFWIIEQLPFFDRRRRAVQIAADEIAQHGELLPPHGNRRGQQSRMSGCCLREQVASLRGGSAGRCEELPR